MAAESHAFRRLALGSLAVAMVCTMVTETRAQNEPTADSATAPSVESAPLGGPNPGAAGLLPPRMTGLPASLWRGSESDRVAALFGAVDAPVPALVSLMRTLALAEAEPPAGDGAAHLATRIDWLTQDGAVEEALALLDIAGTEDPALFSRWADLNLLLGRAEAPCREVASRPAVVRDPGLPVFCAARSGDWPRAALLLTTIRTLGDMPERRIDLFERFLDPELHEERGPLAPPLRPTPLEFRLFEALGEPLPTAPLPLPYSVLDLAGTNGWRAQIEAAERLARAGALPANRLLGLYTLRRPAASGGVWDRVAALQAFEQALRRNNPSLVEQRLIEVWPQMASGRLLVPFATLFGRDLTRALPELDGRAARMARRAVYLSPAYEEAAASVPSDDREGAFLAAISRGEAPQGALPDLPHAAAVAAGFGGAAVPEVLRAQLADGRLGEIILRAVALCASGAEGNGPDLTDGLATLRALGLEDSARRTALQLMILDAERARR